MINIGSATLDEIDEVIMEMENKFLEEKASIEKSLHEIQRFNCFDILEKDYEEYNCDKK